MKTTRSIFDNNGASDDESDRDEMIIIHETVDETVVDVAKTLSIKEGGLCREEATELLGNLERRPGELGTWDQAAPAGPPYSIYKELASPAGEELTDECHHTQEDSQSVKGGEDLLEMTQAQLDDSKISLFHTDQLVDVAKHFRGPLLEEAGLSQVGNVSIEGGRDSLASRSPENGDKPGELSVTPRDEHSPQTIFIASDG